MKIELAHLRPDASKTSLGRLANPISEPTQANIYPVLTTHPQTGAEIQGRGVKKGVKRGVSVGG